MTAPATSTMDQAGRPPRTLVNVAFKIPPLRLNIISSSCRRASPKRSYLTSIRAAGTVNGSGTLLTPRELSLRLEDSSCLRAGLKRPSTSGIVTGGAAPSPQRRQADRVAFVDGTGWAHGGRRTAAAQLACIQCLSGL